MNEPEIWLPVVGYEGLYSVSDLGRVRSESKMVFRRAGNNYRTKARIMRPGTGKHAPYQSVRLLDAAGVTTTRYVHHLVLAAFVGPMPAGQEGCHGDRDPTNNRKGNLRWDTRSRNHADKRDHGTSFAGERHPMAKLDEATVLAMRKRVAEGAAPTTLWKEFPEVSLMTAYRAATGRSWSHL
jgi:hypothetical protein